MVEVHEDESWVSGDEPWLMSELEYECELLKAQDYCCAGCRNQLTRFHYSSHTEWAVDEDYYLLPADPRFQGAWKVDPTLPPRVGLLQYKKSRSQGGTVNEIEDLEIMCKECLGTFVRSVRLPNYLLIKSKNWLHEGHRAHRRGRPRSFNHLVRLAVERYISTEDELLKEALELEKAKSLKNDLMKEISAMLSAVDEMRSGYRKTIFTEDDS